MTSTDIYTPFLPGQYCVYHTTYSGKLLPANYIGSTSVDNVLNNYYGSVASKRYKAIWLSELKLHPELFSTSIVSYHDTRSNATWKELQIQKIFNVVKSDLFVNRAYASINGFGDTTYTPEEKAATKQKKADTYANKTPEQKAAATKKYSDTRANRTPEENAITSKLMSDAHANRTPEQKEATANKYFNTMANKTPEQKATTTKKKSGRIAPDIQKENQSKIKSEMNTGSRWFNDSVINKFQKEHPGEGWILGRLNQKPSTLGNKWYNNGTQQICSKTKPDGWVRGMLPKQQIL